MNAGFFMPDGSDIGLFQVDGKAINKDWFGFKNRIQAVIFMGGKLIIDDIDTDNYYAKYTKADLLSKLLTL